MPGGGSQKGDRRGGRKAGTPNKSTVARAEKARQQLLDENIKKEQKKRAIDVMDEFMLACAAVAVRYQPHPHNPDGNEDQFERWARLTLDFAAPLAKFQSPALGVYKVYQETTTPKEQDPKLIEGAKVIDINDPHELGRIYRKMIVSVRSA